MQKILAAVASLVGIVCLVLATANFTRLESRTIAPSIGELSGYVGVPSLVGIASLVVFAVYFFPFINGNEAGPSTPSPSLPPSVNPPSSFHAKSDTHDTDRTVDQTNADRLHVWNIIDELSDSLREDDDASEALFVVRERYHRLQFGRPEEPAPHPTAQKSPNKIAPA
jgi:hypothetical protein